MNQNQNPEIENLHEIFEGIFNNSPAGIIITDINHKILYYNPAISGIFPQTETGILKTNIFELISSNARNIHENSGDFFNDKGEEHIVLEICRDDSEKYFEVDRSPVNAGGRNYITYTFRDVTKRVSAEKKLTEERNVLNRILNNSVSGMILQKAVRSENGEIVDFETLLMNDAAREISGHLRTQNLSEKDRQQFPGNRNDGLFEKYKYVAEKGMPTNFEHFFPHPKVRKWYQVYISKFGDGLIKTYTDINLRKNIEKKLEESREKMRAYAAHLQKIKEEERLRIAREIHDEIGQVMTVLNLNFAFIRNKLEDHGWEDEDIFLEIDNIQEIFDNTVDNLRDIIHALRPQILDDLGLIEALQWQLEEFENRSGIECCYDSNIENLDIGKDCNISVFRIFQEALTNIESHAEAGRVEVKLTVSNRKFTLSIKDNGRGFSQNEIDGTNTFGILGMEERANICRGKIDIKSGSGGTELTLIIPLENIEGGKDD